jgi:hypothetical protein
LLVKSPNLGYINNNNKKYNQSTGAYLQHNETSSKQTDLNFNNFNQNNSEIHERVNRNSSVATTTTAESKH